MAPRYRHVLKSGNIYDMVGEAVLQMKLLGGHTREEVDELRRRVQEAVSRPAALAVLREWFLLEGEE